MINNIPIYFVLPDTDPFVNEATVNGVTANATIEFD